ncbi:hypothetical protein [Sulfitobacter sp. JB4-11]|uniref:hypothetical protein n=1 Tax=Sulfitobacter rhodophyticola TaxID=3238304 RepID=UPI003D81C2C7
MDFLQSRINYLAVHKGGAAVTVQRISRLQLCLMTFGVIIGIVGILHGSAELLKGTMLVESHSVEALPVDWPNSAFYTLTRGSPVFSVLTGIPFFALGLLAISVSIALIVFSLTVIRLNGQGLLLFFLLSVGIFLFGAGRGTPVAISLPVLVVCAIFLLTSNKKTRNDASKKKIFFFFNAFYWSHIASWILFFPGLFILSFYQAIPSWLFIFAFASMPISSLGSLICGLMYDRAIS